MAAPSNQMPPLYELEAQIMDALWHKGTASVRDVQDALNATSERQRAYTTVMTTMARLARKGVLGRQKIGKGYLYTPRATREEYREACARAAVDALVAEYGEVALAHFSRAMGDLDADRRTQLQRLSAGD